MITMIDDRRLQIYLESLPAPEAAAVTQRVDDLRRDCGCLVGSIVMLSVTTIWIAYTLLISAVDRSWQHIVVTGLVVLIVSALTGKLLGLGLARVRLYLAVRSLRLRCGDSGPRQMNGW
jgi:hypothetical protein